MNQEMEWLIKQAPKRDLVNSSTKIEYILNTIDHLKSEQYPYTFGLFGSWGSGKTTFLSLLSTNKQTRKYNPIYFNAWKYAGIIDISSILTYKILIQLSHLTNVERAELKISNILLALGNKYKNDLGTYLKDYVGIDPLELINDLKDINKLVDNDKKNVVAIKEYYTQTDKAQDLVYDFFEKVKTPLLIYIDELDRCDPNEAFEVIKRLRIFFGMRGAPLIFILSVNPEPIGMAIRHQYGLSDEAGAYETNRILEKFVDDYIDMSQPILLDNYIHEIWGDSNLKEASFVHYLETISQPKDYNEDTVGNSTTLLAISTNNPYYNNLRVLSKSFKYSLTSRSYHLWTIWHLEILKQCHKKTRNNVAKISSDLRDITRNATISLIYIYFEKVKVNSSSKIDFINASGNTPFSIFRSIFWDNAKKHYENIKIQQTTEMIEKREILGEILSDYNVMDFLIQLCLVRFKLKINLEKTIESLDETLGNFAYELANY